MWLQYKHVRDEMARWFTPLHLMVMSSNSLQLGPESPRDSSGLSNLVRCELIVRGILCEIWLKAFRSA